MAWMCSQWKRAHCSSAGLRAETARGNLMGCSIYLRRCNGFMLQEAANLWKVTSCLLIAFPHPHPSALICFIFLTFFPQIFSYKPSFADINLPWVYVHGAVGNFFFPRKCGSLRQVGRVDNSRLMTNPDHGKIKLWTESPKDTSSLLQGPARWVLPKQIRGRTPNSSEEILRGQRLRKTQKTKI